MWNAGICADASRETRGLSSLRAWQELFVYLTLPLSIFRPKMAPNANLMEVFPWDHFNQAIAT